MDVRGLVGRQVKRLREQRDLTQEALAELAGVDQRYISQLESGRRNPSLLKLDQVAKALGTDIKLLFP